MITKTKRLILRPWVEADAEECYRYAKDPDDYYPFYFGFYRFGLRCPFLPYNEDIEKLLK